MGRLCDGHRHGRARNCHGGGSVIVVVGSYGGDGDGDGGGCCCGLRGSSVECLVRWRTGAARCECPPREEAVIDRRCGLRPLRAAVLVGKNTQAGTFGFFFFFFLF